MTKQGPPVIRRRTGQRELVLEAVREGNHPSAQEIFQAVSRHKRMSFGTVYRNLQILEEAGEIAAVKIDPVLLHYDRDTSPHHHLQCTGCGKIFDVPVPYSEDLNAAAASHTGFSVDSHTITFQGRCSTCAGLAV
jgi:Fe2+ or Zn2+ uptake regulation protein